MSQTHNQLIKSSKAKYYNNKFFEATGNPKKTWELINQIRGSIKKGIKPQFIINNERIIERRVIANEESGKGRFGYVWLILGKDFKIS